MTQSASPTHELLDQLSSDTERRVAALEDRTRGVVDLEHAYADIQKKFEQAERIDDERERAVRMRILEASLEELRKDAAKEREDLAQAVFGLNAMLESMGEEYAQLSKPSAEDLAPVREAERRLAEAQRALEQAGQLWFQWRRERAVRECRARLARAEQNLREAEHEAARRARKRLLEADMDRSLQEFMLRVEKTIEIMQHRMRQIEEQLRTVTVRKADAFEVKQRAAQALEQLDEQLNRDQAELAREEELLDTLENGSPEHAAQTRKISDLRARVEELRGRRNTAFVLFQSKEKYAAELEIHEKTQIKLRDNQRMWITSLRSDTEERVVTFRSRLEAMKAASDQDIAKELDDLGAAIDQSNAEYMAAVGAASDRLRMDKIEKHPERIAKMMEVQAAQAEALQRIIEREGKELEKFRRLYGIDPTKSSFFTYATRKSSPGAEPADEVARVADVLGA